MKKKEISDFYQGGGERTKIQEPRSKTGEVAVAVAAAVTVAESRTSTGLPVEASAQAGSV